MNFANTDVSFQGLTKFLFYSLVCYRQDSWYIVLDEIFYIFLKMKNDNFTVGACVDSYVRNSVALERPVQDIYVSMMVSIQSASVAKK